jgi:polyferredoxin/copper chaperone CopZ
MAKKSGILKNWPKFLLQWGVLAAIVATLTGLVPSEKAADPEAYCPMGGLQALATYLANNSLPCSMTSLQVAMGLALAAAVILFSKLFCGYICPLGTVQDLLIRLRNHFRIKSIKITNGSVADKALRIVKYGLLFLVFYMTIGASELFCKNIDPYYALATAFQGELILWMSIVSVCVMFLGSFVIDMFWCRYICPLGAISNSLKFWVWIGVLFGAWYVAGVLGLELPWTVLLGAFCILGYLLEIFNTRPSLQILHVTKDEIPCNNCGLCVKKCPYHIELRDFRNGMVNHVDCTLCGECVAACNSGALNIGISKPTKSKAWNFIPPVLAVLLVASGIWAGGKMEIPTIDMKWDMENVQSLEKMEVDGLRSVKCFGSAMTFKAKLQEIEGIHGVRVFVGRKAAEIFYDPSATSEENILKAMFVPSRFKIKRLDGEAVPMLKIVTIRTEGMYDRYDINYLGHQFYQTGMGIYGLETEFACPLIVRVYMDAALDLDQEWFEEVVEKKEVTVPVTGGGRRTVTLDYDFVKVEDQISSISAEDFNSMF